jgi:hypothetical protein
MKNFSIAALPLHTQETGFSRQRDPGEMGKN